MSNIKLGVISNPGSTRMKRGMKAVRSVLAARPDIAHRELSAIEEIGDILREFADAGIEIVAVNGGDGTVQAAITSIFSDKPYDTPPVFAVLPGGRTNMTGEALGAFNKPTDHLRDLIVRTDAGEMPETALLPFVSMRLTPDHSPVFGTFFGTATIVRGIEFCRRVIYPLRLPNFIAHTVAILYLSLVAVSPFKTKRSPMRREPIAITFGGSVVSPKPYFVVLVTTLNRLILGLSTTSGIGEGGLRFTSVEYSVGAMARSLWALAFGRPSGKIVRGLARRRVAEMEILTDCPVTLDGEMFQPEPGKPVLLKATAPLKFVRYDDA